MYWSQQQDQDVCERCGCSLIIKERFLATSKLGQADNIFSSPRTQTFDAIDLETKDEVILRVVHSNEENLVRPLKDAVTALRFVHSLSPHSGVMQLVKPDEYGYFTWRIQPDEPDSHCMVTQKVAGITLQQWINANGAASEALAIPWLRQILTALKELHHANFLHRDIKPENIIVEHSHRLVLIDLDAICSIDSALPTSNPAQRAGTIAYMAPEQANGQPLPSSDLYSVGQTMIELLTGKLPSKVARNPKTGKVNWRKESSRLSKPLTLLVDLLTEQSELYRPASADRVLNLLTEVESELARKQKWRWLDNTVVRVVAVVILLSACVGIGASLSQTQSEADRLLAEGNQLILNGALTEGLALIEEAISLEPNSVELLSSLAIAQAFLGDTNAAIANYEKALEIEPDNPYLYYNLANVYEQVDLEQAIEYYTVASEMNSFIRANALNNLARAYLLTEQLQLAEEILSIPIENIENPLTRAAFFKNLGWLNYLKGDFETARSQLAQSIEAYAYQPDPYCLLALIQEASGEDNFNDRMTCIGATAPIDKPEVQNWKQQLGD
nr:tetratricopeptide repeat protein [cf. Phormidesmis sp. LEGE 11477]